MLSVLMIKVFLTLDNWTLLTQIWCAEAFINSPIFYVWTATIAKGCLMPAHAATGAAGLIGQASDKPRRRKPRGET